MATTQTLILPEEVKELAKVNRNIAPCDLNDIRQVEKTVARTCLGKDFYAAMVADLADYSETASWEAGAYSEGYVVFFNGLYYRAKTGTSNEPTVKADWEKAPKFETGCYNDLWCEVLGRYLALLVVQNSLPILSTPLTAQGTVKREGEGHKPAKEESVVRLQNWLATQVATAFENLDEYLTDNSDNECFSLYLGNQDETACCTSSCGDCSGSQYMEFQESGTVCIYANDPAATSCNCPACLKKHKAQTNRYIIA